MIQVQWIIILNLDCGSEYGPALFLLLLLCWCELGVLELHDDGLPQLRKAFSDAFTGHLEVVARCLSQADDDLSGAVRWTHKLMVELLGSAQKVILGSAKYRELQQGQSKF